MVIVQHKFLKRKRHYCKWYFDSLHASTELAQVYIDAKFPKQNFYRICNDPEFVARTLKILNTRKRFKLLNIHNIFIPA